jgi:hypothetical protein
MDLKTKSLMKLTGNKSLMIFIAVVTVLLLISWL